MKSNFKLAILRTLKSSLLPSTLKFVNDLRYQSHLAQQRLANRLFPWRVLARRNLGKMDNVRLHWGCGQRRIEGWVNIDGWRTGATDYVHDLRTKLPFSDLSVELIFSEHVLEHVDIDVAEKVLADFFRVMKHGGRARLIVPDLEKCCRAYLDHDKEWFSKVDADSPTAGDGLNKIFYSHFHRYIYDSETLTLMLRKAGFTDVTPSAHLASVDERLNLDNDSESRSLVSLYVEVQK